MNGRRPSDQPTVPLAVVTLAVVVLALLAGNAGVRLISGLVQLVMVIVALVVMALVWRYLWSRGRSSG
jgi:hypothetical protein